MTYDISQTELFSNWTQVQEFVLSNQSKYNFLQYCSLWLPFLHCCCAGARDLVLMQVGRNKPVARVMKTHKSLSISESQFIFWCQTDCAPMLQRKQSVTLKTGILQCISKVNKQTLIFKGKNLILIMAGSSVSKIL